MLCRDGRSGGRGGVVGYRCLHRLQSAWGFGHAQGRSQALAGSAAAKNWLGGWPTVRRTIALKALALA